MSSIVVPLKDNTGYKITENFLRSMDGCVFIISEHAYVLKIKDAYKEENFTHKRVDECLDIVQLLSNGEERIAVHVPEVFYSLAKNLPKEAFSRSNNFSVGEIVYPLKTVLLPQDSIADFTVYRSSVGVKKEKDTGVLVSPYEHVVGAVLDKNRYLLRVVGKPEYDQIYRGELICKKLNLIPYVV